MVPHPLVLGAPEDGLGHGNDGPAYVAISGAARTDHAPSVREVGRFAGRGPPRKRGFGLAELGRGRLAHPMVSRVLGAFQMERPFGTVPCDVVAKFPWLIT